jgi:predicted nuclease with TOPRIM domain
MTDDGGVPPLSFGPQEWKWFLQHRNLIISSSSETVDWEMNSERQIDALAPNAAMNCAFPGEHNVAQGLTWLHRVQFRDMNALYKAVGNVQSQQSALKRRMELLEEDCSLSEKNWTLLCTELGVRDHVTLETQDISQAVAKWWETVSEQPEHGMQRVLSQHADFLRDVLTHYKHICKRTHQPRVYVNNLQRFLENGSILTSEELLNELHELLAFLQSRRIECSKQHIAAFMSLVASDDIEMLRSYESGLKRVISDVSAPLSNTMSIIHELESKQARVRKSRERLETSRNQLKIVDSEVQSLQDDIEWCRKRVESVKQNLENEIATLLGGNQVQIIIEE